MTTADKIEAAKESFGQLLEAQLKRVEEMKLQGDFVDYKSLDQLSCFGASVCSNCSISEYYHWRRHHYRSQ